MHVVLSGGCEGTSGLLSITIRGPGGAWNVFYASRAPGDYTLPLYVDINSLPVGTDISEIEAYWYVGDQQPHDAYPLGFRVLGVMNNTLYNTPLEGMCMGSLAPGLVEATANQCDFYPDWFKGDYLQSFGKNGSGEALHWPFKAQKSWGCTNIQPQRHVDLIRTADGMPVGDGVIAMIPQPYLAFGDPILMAGDQYNSWNVLGWFHDTCDGCQVDHYVSSPQLCRSDIGSYGGKLTIRLR